MLLEICNPILWVGSGYDATRSSCRDMSLPGSCPGSCKVRRTLILVVVAVVFWTFVWSAVSLGLLRRATLQILESCNNENSLGYLDNLCRDYLSGMVGGSLCEPLCVRREVEFVRCLGHGVKLHVLLAQWAANTVVLKTAKPLGSHRATSHLDRPDKLTRIMTRQEFVNEANMTLFLNLAGGRHVPSTLAAIERVFSECDVLGDGQLSYTEAVVCWQLLETDEFVLLSVLSGVSAIPDVYGACGNMYAMQYASSQSLLFTSAVTDYRTWHFRARLAIALIEMAYSIETTPYGTLYLCDVQEPNFGIVHKPGGTELVAKTIDVDISWFEGGMKSSVEFEKGKSCKADSDCGFISCHVPCNKSTHACAGILWSNNLQVICRRFFVKRMLGLTYLLRDPPASVEADLRVVLEQCASFSHPQPHINITIMNRLLSLLHTSLL